MLTTIAAIKAEAGIEPLDTTLDATLTAWLVEIGGFITDYIGQEIETTTVTNYVFDGRGQQMFAPPQWPVTAVSSLAVRSGIGSGATWSTIPTTEWEFVANSSRGAHVLYPSGFTRGSANYRISFTYGYATVPGTISRIANEMVRARLLESHIKGGDKRFGLTSANIGGQSSVGKSFRDLTPKWEQDLRGFRVMTV